MTSSFQKFSGICGILAGLAGILYLVSFLVLLNPAALLPALALLMVGILAIVTLTGIYQSVRVGEDGYALVGLLFGVAGAVGAAVHAAFDLTNTLHPPSTPFAYANPVDPRGFLTFAMAGIGAIILSFRILHSKALPRGTGYLGVASGVFLILLYIFYLATLNAQNSIVLGLILISGILQPVWYLWIGGALLSRSPMEMAVGTRGPWPIPTTGDDPHRK